MVTCDWFWRRYSGRTVSVTKSSGITSRVPAEIPDSGVNTRRSSGIQRGALRFLTVTKSVSNTVPKLWLVQEEVKPDTTYHRKNWPSVGRIPEMFGQIFHLSREMVLKTQGTTHRSQSYYLNASSAHHLTKAT